MEAIEAYQTYLALKNHFKQDSYDYFKYNKKVRVSNNSLNKRKDRFFFNRLAKKLNGSLEEFLVANLSVNPDAWVGDLCDHEAENVYLNWKKRQQALMYVFKNEISFMEDYDEQQLNELLKPKKHIHPPVLRKYLYGEISSETLIILDSVLTFMKKYDTIYTDPVYKDISKLCKKYRPFLVFDQNQARKAIRDIIGL